MGEGELQLLEPAEWMRDEYLGYVEEFRAAGAPYHQNHRQQVIDDFPSFLRGCRDDAAGRHLEGRVPQTNWWLFRGRRLLATCRLRHRLNDILARQGGHIGYDVRPGEQGKGYATRMLAMVLDKARDLGLMRVMLTCDKSNPASARVIRKNGGQLDGEYWWEQGCSSILIQNYWIDLHANRDATGQPGMEDRRRYDAVIFDLGGTLVDNFDTAGFVAVLRQAAGLLGMEGDALVRAAVGADQVHRVVAGVYPSCQAVLGNLCRQTGGMPPAEAIAAAAELWTAFARRTLTP